MTIPILQIRQTTARIGIDADAGQFRISQRPAELHLTTRPGELHIRQYKPQLQIDQSKAFAAYNGGGSLEMNDRIYSGIREIFLEGIAHRAEQGNRMVAIHMPGNTIADIAGTVPQLSFPEFRGPASMDNVDISFDVRPPDISVTRAVSELQVDKHPAEIEYKRGKLDIYMQQYNSVSYIPPALDIGI